MIAISNTGKSPMFVRGILIPPGETRHFDPAELAGYVHEPDPALVSEAAKQQPDAILELLDNPIPVIIDAITARDGAGAPKIRADELARLKAAEEGGKTRKGLMAAIAEEELRRANEQQADNADTEMDAFVATLKTMGDDELLDQLELHAGQAAMIAAIESVINERAAAESAPK